MGTATSAHKRVDIRRNDTVKVMTGRDQGKQGRVLRVFPDEGKVLVEHVMLVKKHVRPNPAENIKGGIAEQESPIALSNVRWFVRHADRCASGTKCAATRKFEFARSAAQRWRSS